MQCLLQNPCKKKKKNPGKNYCISLQEFKVSLEQNEGNNKLLDQYKGLRRTRQDFLLSSKWNLTQNLEQCEGVRKRSCKRNDMLKKAKVIWRWARR